MTLADAKKLEERNEEYARQQVRARQDDYAPPSPQQFWNRNSTLAIEAGRDYGALYDQIVAWCKQDNRVPYNTEYTVRFIYVRFTREFQLPGRITRNVNIQGERRELTIELEPHPDPTVKDDGNGGYVEVDLHVSILEA